MARKIAGPRLLVTSTPIIQGRSVEYLGMVSAQAILGANVIADIFANLRDFFGGRAKSYERILARARQEALDNLEEEARALGADAIIGVDLDYNMVGPQGAMMMVSVNGTAVRLGPPADTGTPFRP